MTEHHPAFERYMARFETSLRGFECAETAEIARDLRGHIAEAHAMGKPIDEVLSSIGPADAMARAYAIELELNPRGEKLRRTIGGVLRVVGILAAASFVTLIVVLLLGTIGIGFTITGAAVAVFSLVEATGTDVSFLRLGPLHPFAGVGLGLVITALGGVASIGLWAYLRALTRTLLRMLPTRG